ncbi:MAG: peptidylprolyl isomerase [Campylobacterales bacterium]
MIEWMHHHKRWLIITIWIATISFILAGAVGWGSLSFGKKADTIAEIGEIEIRLADVNQIYNQLFNLVNQQIGGGLDDQKAEQMGLKRAALNQAIKEGYFRELARQLGLEVTPEEVAQVLKQEFKREEFYNRYLQRIGMLKKDYEELLKHRLIVRKLLSFLRIDPSPLSIEAYGASLYQADKLQLKVEEVNLSSIHVSEEEIQKYYNSHKQQFLTEPKLKIEVVNIPIEGEVSDEELQKFYNDHPQNYLQPNGEVAPFEEVKGRVKLDYLAEKVKRKAFKKYLNLKKGKIHGELIEVKLNQSNIPKEGIEQLVKRGHMKPIRVGGRFLVGKLVEQISPHPKPIEEVREEVVKLVQQQKGTEKLKELGERELGGEFTGVETPFVTQFDEEQIADLTGLNTDEARQFLLHLFSNWKGKGYLIFRNKLLLYRIVAQRLIKEDEFEQNREKVQRLSAEMINHELINDLFNQLTQLYPSTSYLKQ